MAMNVLFQELARSCGLSKRAVNATSNDLMPDNIERLAMPMYFRVQTIGLGEPIFMHFHALHVGDMGSRSCTVCSESSERESRNGGLSRRTS
jgi:hypothetical protein